MSRVSTADLYHRLGKLEGLIELNSKAHLATQEQLQVMASALSTLQAKQSTLEGAMASHRAVSSAGYEGLKSLVIPIAAIVATYMVTRTSPTHCEQNGKRLGDLLIPRITHGALCRPSNRTGPPIRLPVA
jgi:hypothetical protein